jgi:apolipoprotein N-acyltransferase
MQPASDAGPPIGVRLGSRGVGILVLGEVPAAFAMAALSGVLYAAAFPPLSLAFASWFALVPLLVAAAALPPWHAAAAGMIWTLSMAAGVAWFLPGMLSDYFGLSAVTSWAGSMAVVAALAGVYVGVYAAWVAWLVRRRAASPLLLAGGWLACEFARAHGLVGNPWALSAYSQMQVPALMQIADATGPYGIGALIGAVNACLAALCVPVLRGRRFRWSLMVVAAAFCGVLLYGQWRLGQSFGDGPPLAVAVVQGGTAPSPPQQPALRAARLEQYVKLTRVAAAGRPALIVWPEYAVESYLEEVSAARAAVLGIAAEAGADVILGGPHFEPAQSGTRYHNSVYLVRDGRLAGRYDKNLLVPFAEDDPLAGLVGRRGVRYAPGRGGAILPAAGLRAGVFLCVESMYPEYVRTLAGDGAQVLVNLSNDSWFAHPDAARHQLDIAALRAIENRRYLVRATPTGFSAVIDPHGRTIARSALNAPEVLAADVRASGVSTPYQRWGDAFAWLILACVAGATIHVFLKRSQCQSRRREL